jgi:hypothetical protein
VRVAWSVPLGVNQVRGWCFWNIKHLNNAYQTQFHIIYGVTKTGVPIWEIVSDFGDRVAGCTTTHSQSSTHLLIIQSSDAVRRTHAATSLNAARGAALLSSSLPYRRSRAG